MSPLNQPCGLSNPPGDAQVRHDQQKYDFTSDHWTQRLGPITQPILCQFILFAAIDFVHLFGNTFAKNTYIISLFFIIKNIFTLQYIFRLWNIWSAVTWNHCSPFPVISTNRLLVSTVPKWRLRCSICMDTGLCIGISNRTICWCRRRAMSNWPISGWARSSWVEVRNKTYAIITSFNILLNHTLKIWRCQTW